MGYAATITQHHSTILDVDNVSALLHTPAFAALITAAVKAATPVNSRGQRPRTPAAKRPPPIPPLKARLYCMGMTAIAALTVDTSPQMTSSLLNAPLQITTLYPAHQPLDSDSSGRHKAIHVNFPHDVT